MWLFGLNTEDVNGEITLTERSGLKLRYHKADVHQAGHRTDGLQLGSQTQKYCKKLK